MTENTFNTEELNSSINSPQYYVDDDGSFKFISPVLSSSNFDGSVPVFEGSASVSELISGMYIQIEGTDFFPIVNISKDDPGLEDSPSTDVVISYLDDQNEVQAAVYDLSDVVTVRYEDWDEKYLGTQGWLLTYGGNAIFSNVAVRGRIEAEEGFLSGLEVTGNINIGDDPGTPGNPGIVINQDGIFAYDSAENETFSISASTGTVVIGSGGGGLDLEQLEDYLNSASYINNPDLISGSYISAPQLRNPGQTVINGGNITTGTINADLITTGFLSGSRINGGVISGQFISGGTISAANIIGGTGNFTGDVQVVSRFTNYTGSAYLTKNAITNNGAEFPALDLRYDYLGTFVGRGTLGFGLIDFQPAVKLSSDGSIPMQIYPGGDLYIATTFGSVYVSDDLYVTGALRGVNNVEFRQTVVDTILPNNPGSYINNTLWVVV